MKNIFVGMLITLVVSVPSIIGMEYTYTQATHDDVESVVALMNTQAYKDSDKIVIVPEKFRQSYVQSTVATGKLFVAKQNNTVIGYKKLYCITDLHELEKLLTEEVRCKGTQPVVCGALNINNGGVEPLSSTAIADLMAAPVTYIYNGADFTHPDHRRKRINTHLMEYALNAITQAVLEHSKERASTHLAMIYGLTKSNAGQEHDVLDGRTHGIVQQFIPHAQSITQQLDKQSPTTLLLSRHVAFKPSFDPHAPECEPLPDAQSIAGYGCVIACALEQKTQQ